MAKDIQAKKGKAAAAPAAEAPAATATSPAADAAPAVTHKRVPRPDKAAHEKELDAIKAKIDALQKQMSGIQSNLSGTDNIKGTYDSKRKELRARLDELSKQRTEVNETRNKILEKIKMVQANIKKTNEDVRSSKDRLGVKSVDEIESRIESLEQELTAGNLKLIDEKRVVSEISSLKKARKTLETLGSQASSVEGEKQQLDKLRAELNALDPRKKQINDEFDVVKAELKVVDEGKKKDMGSYTELLDQKKALKAEIDGLYESMRQLRADFKAANDEWYNHERAERERRQKEFEEKKKSERAEKLKRAAERELEAAQTPAFTAEIDACNALIHFLSQYIPGKAGATTSTASAASPFAATNIRKVDPFPEGSQLKTKKDDDFESYIVLGGKGKRKGPKGSASSTPAAPAVKQLKLDMVSMSMFDKLKVPVPSGIAEVEASLQAIEEKKAKFLADQAEQTAKNKAKAEAKIAVIKAKAEASGNFDDAVAELGGDVEEDKDPKNL